MCKLKPGLIAFMVLFCGFSNLFSQISVSPSTGCLPNGVTNALFSYTGSGNPTNIVWNYGDGSPTTTLTQTQHSYPNVGSYIVTFSAIIAGSPVTYTFLVTVNPAPTGSFNFQIPTSHCTPMSVNFSATSPQANVIFSWAFGDLGGGSGATITHIYGIAGNFTPAVTVQNTLTGCFLNVTGTVIKASDPPSLAIVASNGLKSCSASFTTALDAGTSVSHSPISGGGLTYNWNLGSFGVFNQANTGNIIFAPAGNYTVVLSATDNNNCSATTSAVVSLVTPTLSAVVPPSVCINYQSLTNGWFSATVNSSEPSTLWDMGDGNTIIFPIPLPPPYITPILQPNVPYTAQIHFYTIPGLKTLTITNTTGQCVATVTKTIFVEEITPAFTSTPPSYTCSPNFSVGYLNQTTVNSSSTLSYTWSLNNWAGVLNSYTSTALNPTFNLTQGSPNPYANYGHPPYYVHAKLYIISQPLGCISNITNTFDTIQRPTALFEVSQAEGCVPLSVTFTNTSVTNTTGVFTFPITSYSWNFGASPTSTLAGPSFTSPAFTYTAPGVYYPTLTINTTGGCTSVSYPHTITVVNPPTISYTLPATPVCAGHPTVQILLGSPQSVQHWHIQGDQGYFSSCVNDPSPTWQFSHAVPSVQNLTISAYQNGCESSIVVPAAITVKGPVGNLRFETNCTVNRKSVKFYYELEDATNTTLDFGDGSALYTISGIPNGIVTANTTHTYAAAGNYTVTLIANNGGNLCPSYTSTVLVTVRQLVADFVFVDSVICKGSYLYLDASPSVHVFKASNRGYSWYIDNLAPQQTASYTFIATNDFSLVGIHSVKLVVKDTNECVNSVTKYFRVSSPAPNFTFNANPICFSNMPVYLTNLTPQLPDPVSNYIWTMGDSAFHLPHVHSTITGTTPGHSPTFTYTTIGGFQTQTFTVTLVATNTLGCKSYTRQTLTVNDPIIYVVTNNFMGCAPQAKTFSFYAANTHTNYSIYYGEGAILNNTTYSTNATYTNTHVYFNPGSYIPSFTVTDFGGCSKTETLGPIEIQTTPVASFTFVDVNTGIANSHEYCNALTPSVTSTSQSPYPLGYGWNFNNNYLYVPYSTASYIYPGNGSYTISLTAQTIPSGCPSTVSFPVTLYVPKIDYKIVPDTSKTTYCLGDPITVSVTTRENIPGFQWDFGNGVPTSTILSTFLHMSVYTNTYFPVNTNGDLIITLTGYSGAAGIDCKDVKRKTFHIKRVLPAFTRNNELLAADSIHCLGKQEIFKNQSTTNVTTGLTYTWTLGDGNIDTATDVTHSYSQPGTYYVKLHAFEPIYNCMADLTKKMIIFPLPTASLSLDSNACPVTPFHINGSGSPGMSGILSGTILPGPLNVNFTGSNTFTLNTTATVSTTYSLTVTDDNGCQNSAPSASIYIQEAAPVVNWDTTIIIGQPTPLNAYAGAGFSYTWSIPSPYLNCDTCLIYNPVSSTTNNITYSVMVQDKHQCSVVKNTYRIHVDIKVSLDVPTAFTPNGDGINDIIFPNGWGLRKLNYFKVFNRWGQLIFESNDLNVGWDGVYLGVPQNIETYVYQASAETYLDTDKTLTKSGTFKLIR